MSLKPVPSLGNLIQRKGEAERPNSLPQRGADPAPPTVEAPPAAPEPAPTPPQPAAVEPPREAPEPARPKAEPRRQGRAAAPQPAAPEPRAKALTLRLTMSQYEKLRRYAFDQNLTHQDVLEAALLEYLGQ